MNDTTRGVGGDGVPIDAIAGYGVPIAWILGLLALSASLSPVARFLGATVGLLLAVKVGSWILVRSNDYSLSWPQRVLFWTVWPGVRPDRFAGSAERGSGSDPADGPTEDGTGSREYDEVDPRTFVEGYVSALAGVLLAVGAVLAPPLVGATNASWLLLFAALAVVHFGIGRMLPVGLRWLGYPAPTLFDDPLRTTGVGDFWSQRWNRPFVEMNRLFLTRPLSSRVGMGTAAIVAFLASGVLHELAISYPAGAGWGGPMAYFVVQGVLYTAEHRLFPEPTGRPGRPRRLGRLALRRAWTYAAVLVPLPLLFHAPFRTTFLVPLVEWGRSLLVAHPLSAYVGWGLWVGAAGHFLVLVASYRVPQELDWDTDLQSLKPLNRKLLWTYGGYIVMLIFAFGVMTAAFHEQLLAGTPVALGLAGLIALFWTVRILVDLFYFSHDDWPDGPEFVVGHALLTSLFLTLVAVYAGTIVYHFV